MRNNNNKGSRSNVNKHELVYGESSSNAEMHQCLFIICVIVYNLYYCCYAKTSSPAAQKTSQQSVRKPYCPLLVFNSHCFELNFQQESTLIYIVPNLERTLDLKRQFTEFSLISPSNRKLSLNLLAILLLLYFSCYTSLAILLLIYFSYDVFTLR